MAGNTPDYRGDSRNMPRRHPFLVTHDDRLVAAFDDLAAELDHPGDFTPEALAEADEAATKAPDGADLTDVPFFTLDPPTAVDLDQAMHLERTATGFTVLYAIADVGRFITPGGALDADVMRRGQTLYFPHRKVALHPPVLSENAASLLPGKDTTAFVWRMQLDRDGVLTSTDLQRAIVRSRYRTDYATVTDEMAAGKANEQLTLLAKIGSLRAEQERQRGGASLRIPDQEVSTSEDGTHLSLRPPRESEDWNAHISLLTGMAAANIMREGGVGILRTLPHPDTEALSEFRDAASVLGPTWDDGTAYGEYIRLLDPSRDEHLALLFASRKLFRGASYMPFTKGAPSDSKHAAVGAHYAHTTAPIRRLVDRFSLEICAALVQGHDVPDRLVHSLDQVCDTMSISGRWASAVDRRCVDITEAYVLKDRIGEVFDGVVVGKRPGKNLVSVYLKDAPVMSLASGTQDLGTSVAVRLESADYRRGRLRMHCTSR